MTSPLALNVFALLFGLSCAQFDNQNTYSQNTYVSPEERIRELEEKLTARISQQVTVLRDRIEQLEKQVREMRRSNTYDWIRSDSGSLYKIFTVPKNWDEAQSVCKSFNANLAIIDTEHKNAFVKDLFQKQFGDSESTTDAWIGLKTKAEMTTSDSSYSNFSDSDKVDGCTVIDNEGKWQVKSCALQRVFVCQQINVR
uniref:C-type lectin domain-containing protein n=1 Tax=Steinernema glaseri TaxID=37863 RepID=A0A1I7Y1J6_9BILA